MFLNLLAFSLKIPEGLGQLTEGLGGKMTSEIINTGHVGDTLIILIVVIMVIIYGFLLDHHNMIINLFSSYLGFLAAIFYPYESWGLGGLKIWVAKVVVYAIVFLVTLLILSWTRIFRVYYKVNFLVRWFQAGVSGVLYAGLLTSIILSFLPLDFLGQFSEKTLEIFLGDAGRLFWLAAPMAGLIFLRKKRRSFSGPKYEN